MKSRYCLIIILLSVCAFRPAHVLAVSLKVLTINVWSGLDYIGTLKMGEYESASQRNVRFQSLVAQVKEISPDLIFVQEANPVASYAADLAAAFSMVEIHQVVNGGIKVGSVGIPTNLKEGLVILTRPGLSLQKMGAWKLSGSPGIHSDILSFHLEEAVLALVGKIKVGEGDFFLINVHLVAAPRMPEDMDSFRKSVLGKGKISGTGFNRALEEWREREERRTVEIEKLLGHLKLLPPDVPCIVAGDFNAEPDSLEMGVFLDRSGLTDLLAESENKKDPDTESFTWDVGRNENTSFSASLKDARGKARRGFGYVSAVAGRKSRRLDYIFLGKNLSGAEASRPRIVLKESIGGLKPSDHFGVLAEIDFP